MLSIVAHSDVITSFSLYDIITDIYENMAEGRQFDDDFETFYDNLLQLHQNPININQATQQQLEQLFFLTDEQIDGILMYIYKNGPLHSQYELQLIGELEDYDIRNLLPFITIGPAEKPAFQWKQLLTAKHEAVFRFDARNMENYEKVDKQYTGDPFYTNIKYKYNSDNRVLFGLHGKKDAGEQFIGPDNYGFDSYGGYLQINNLWKFKTIIIGDYKANFGEGLVINNYNTYGPAYNPLSVKNRNQGLQKYGGNNEFQFLRGIGTTIAVQNFNISVFYSFMNLDGNEKDGVLATISKTGYHRTKTEINHRNASHHHNIGLDATYHNRFLEVGITFMENIFHHPFNPSNEFYFHGKAQSVGSAHYRIHNQHWALFGETALASNTKLGVATINGIKYHPMPNLGFALVHRYYSPYFDNMYANAISYKSRINNEQTIYFGTDINLYQPLQVSLSTDIWKDYQQVILKLTNERYQHHKAYIQTNWKYRDDKHRILLRTNYTHFIGSFITRSEIAGTLCKTVKTTDSPWTYGINIVQQAEYRFGKPDIVLQAGVAAFYAPNYNNRFYIYENDVLYAFSSNMLYGRGIRSFINIRYNINAHWHLYLKASNSWTKENNSRTDMHFQIRYTY